jgi:hypothetical protein
MDSATFEDILSLLETPVPYAYEPVVRDIWKVSPEDVERIRFYSTLPYPDRGEAIKTWEAGWAALTKGLSPAHLCRIESRGLNLCIARPSEGSDEWRRIVLGLNDAEYDEMDREGSLAWLESYRANEEQARSLSAAFLALSYAEQITCSRWYKNAAAWGVFESLLSEEDRKAIHSQSVYLDRMEDEMDRREHEWDD